MYKHSYINHDFTNNNKKNNISYQCYGDESFVVEEMGQKEDMKSWGKSSLNGLAT